MEKITMKEKIDVQKPDDLGLDISDLRYFLVMLLFSAVVFFLLISQRLTNTFDGLWNNTWFFGGYWQVVTGRWLWPVIDALRFGIQTEPFNSLLTLSMSALAVTRLRKFFTEKDSVVTYLAGMAVLASTVTGIQLSYRFQSPVFGCSFLFSVLAAERVVRAADFRKAVVQGALLLVMSLACYQTSLDNFCLLLLTYLLLLLFRNVDREKVHAHIERSLCSAAAGMVLYFLLTKLIVWACGWQMASYNGGADVSVLSILKNLPNAIAETYQLFGAYFFQNYYRHNILQPVGFFVLVFLALSIGLLNRFRKMLHRKNWEYILLGVAALIVLPIMCNAIMLITSEAVWLLQMGEGLNLFVPVCLLLLEGTRTNQPMVKKYVRAARTGAVVLAVLVVYGNVCSAVIDQEAMYEGRKTLKSMSDHIADDLMSSGYFDDNEQLPVLFVGRPSSNSSFMKREYYLYANPYAQMGRFWLNDYSARASWKAVFRDITPAKLKHCSVEQYGELYSRTELEQMPVYPQEGYIQQIDGVVVVKISDDYKVDKEFAPLIDLGELFQLIMDDINDS